MVNERIKGTRLKSRTPEHLDEGIHPLNVSHPKQVNPGRSADNKKLPGQVNRELLVWPRWERACTRLVDYPTGVNPQNPGRVVGRQPRLMASGVRSCPHIVQKSERPFPPGSHT